MVKINPRFSGDIYTVVMKKDGEYSRFQASDAQMLSERIKSCQSQGYVFVERYDGINGDVLTKVILNIYVRNLGGSVNFGTILKECAIKIRGVRHSRKKCSLENKASE